MDMDINEIKNILIQHLSLKEVHVMLNNNHYQVIVIDQELSSKTKLEQHKVIYAPLMRYITCNIIHSISIHVFCPDEWDKRRYLYKM